MLEGVLKRDEVESWNQARLRHSSRVPLYVNGGEIPPEPEDSNLLNAYGVLLRLSNRLEESIQALQKAATIAPTDLSIWINMANTYATSGDYAKSVMCLEKALEIDPAHHAALHTKAIIYIRHEKYEEALEVLRHALSLHHNNLALLRQKAIALQRLRKHDELIISLEKILTLDPNDLNSRKALENLMVTS